MTRDEFYSQRDLRTLAYIGATELGARPIHVHIDDLAACSPPGQLAFLALLNMLARVHRRISIRLDKSDAPVLIRTPFSGETLADLAGNTVAAIDPFATFSVRSVPEPDAITIGIGADAADGLDHYIGCSGSIGQLSGRSIHLDPEHRSLRGAAVGACVGASAVFRTSIGLPTLDRAVSAWNYDEGAGADPGPPETKPLDVGRALLIGAGAVASALVYWCKAFGVNGSWTVLDGDTVKLHNTNRGLIFTPRHADLFGDCPQGKAAILAAELPAANPFPNWYDACEELHAREFDVILCLANERNVRHLGSARSATVVLQATTGESWLSELHRHVAGIDDCPGCRLGDIKPAKFGCSTASVEIAEERADAALPFLSAASGLMLCTALQQLQAGDLLKRPRNDWRWDFDSPHRMVATGMRRCRNECVSTLPPALRARINRATRWAHLDSAALDMSG
jgi:hypothetical protein